MNDWTDEYFEAHLALLKTLAAIPAPSHHEDERAAFIKDWLDRAGAPGAYIDEAKNVVLPWGCGSRNDVTGSCAARNDVTVYMAHTDVVFPDLTPLPVREENGLLYAPGVGDDTANAAALMTVIRRLLDLGRTPVQPVLFVFNSCEEGLGNLKGVRQIMKNWAGRVKEVVSFDCTMPGGVVCRAVGSERWRVTVRTRGGHSFSDFGAPSAIHRLALLIARLYEQALPDWDDQHTTYNAGVIRGGTTVNSIAQEAEMLYEYRSDDKKALAMMREQFFDLLTEAQTAAGSGASFSKDLLGERPCGDAVDPAAARALWDRCARAVRSVTGASVFPRSGSTDANLPLSLGIPALTFGLYEGAGEHTREEWLRIDSLKPGLQLAFTLVSEHFR